MQYYVSVGAPCVGVAYGTLVGTGAYSNLIASRCEPTGAAITSNRRDAVRHGILVLKLTLTTRSGISVPRRRQIDPVSIPHRGCGLLVCACRCRCSHKRHRCTRQCRHVASSATAGVQSVHSDPLNVYLYLHLTPPFSECKSFAKVVRVSWSGLKTLCFSGCCQPPGNYSGPTQSTLGRAM